MAGSTQGSIDVLRKSVIIGCLVASLILLHRFAAPSEEFDPTGMLALGFVVLASYTVGELVGVIKLPHITGYLFAGLLLGPSFAHLVPVSTSWAPFDRGVLNEDVIGQLDLFNTLALALIAITAGGELKIDGLKEGYRKIFGVLGGQSIAIFILIPIFFVMVSGLVPAIGLDDFSSFGFAGSLAIGAVLASISLATSPAATIAVINESGAKGEVTQTTLATVVLKDVVVVVLFSLTAAISVSLLGSESTGPGALAQELSWHILGSLFIGAGIGLGIAAYITWVRHEVLLFLVGLIFTSAFVAQQWHLDPALLFIAAGFAASNFSSKGDTLIHEVERLSAPVYVVFFTLAGAKLHLDTLAQMAPYAFTLVAIRMIALYFGVGLGGRAVSAPEPLRRYAWMGFISQAGVALTLAELARSIPDPKLYAGAGDTFATLVIAGIAIHEVIGPVLLKVGLGLAGELPKGTQESEEASQWSDEQPSSLDNDSSRGFGENDTDLTDLVAAENALDVALNSQSQKLNELVQELSSDIQGLVRTFLSGHIANRMDRQEQLLKEVRREFLRYHRRLTLAANDESNDVRGTFRRVQVEASERWRQFVLRQQFDFKRQDWTPLELVEHLDSLVDTLPESIDVSIEPQTYARNPEESPLWQGLRFMLRIRHRLAQLFGKPQRRIQFRTVARYHFSGNAPSRLEAVAALLVANERHLISSTRSLFEQMMSETDKLLEQLDANQLEQSNTNASELDNSLRAFRQHIEEEYNLALVEVERTARDTVNRLSRVLGRLQSEFHADLYQLGTLDLPNWSRRYSRAFNERTRGIQLLEHDYPSAREQVGHGLQTLALELELLGFEGFARGALRELAEPLTRRIHGRGYTQLSRLLDQLDVCLDTLKRVIETEEKSPSTIIDEIRLATDPVHHVAIEAMESTESLLHELQSDRPLAPLLDTLTDGAAALTEVYTIPIGGGGHVGNWSLPELQTRSEIPFRRALVSIMETRVSEALLQQQRTASEEVQHVFEALSEFERMVPFNRELAIGDLSNLESPTVPPEVRNLISEMLIGALRRSQQKLAQIQKTHGEWSEHLFQRFQKDTLREVETLRNGFVSGSLDALGARLKQEAGSSKLFRRDGRGVLGFVQSIVHWVGQTTENIIGPAKLATWKQDLGLSTATQTRALTAMDFNLSPPNEKIPVVYRRLFSDRALEAGDLLSGRQALFQQCLAHLTPAPGRRLRSVGLIGQQGVGKRAVYAALLRKFAKVITLDISGPCTAEEWKAFIEVDGKDILFVIPKLQWLRNSGTANYISELTERIVSDNGKNAFLVVADSPNWGFFEQTSALSKAIAFYGHLSPLGVEDLSEALLTRHNMSGYQLSFPKSTGLPRIVTKLWPRIDSRNLQQEARWFENLHKYSNGVMQDAMLHWLNAIQRFQDKDDIIHLGPIGEMNLSAYPLLPEPLLLTLRYIMRLGWISVDEHAKAFRTSIADSRALLGRLCHFGLIEEDNDRYTVHDHHAGPIHNELQRRGWL